MHRDRHRIALTRHEAPLVRCKPHTLEPLRIGRALAPIAGTETLQAGRVLRLEQLLVVRAPQLPRNLQHERFLVEERLGVQGWRRAAHSAQADGSGVVVV